MSGNRKLSSGSYKSKGKREVSGAHSSGPYSVFFHGRWITALARINKFHNGIPRSFVLYDLEVLVAFGDEFNSWSFQTKSLLQSSRIMCDSAHITCGL